VVQKARRDSCHRRVGLFGPRLTSSTTARRHNLAAAFLEGAALGRATVFTARAIGNLQSAVFPTGSTDAGGFSTDAWSPFNPACRT
jgi:hypothetical protein